ncbi:MAG: hypothetical protein ABL867_10240 [Rickettsiales bacterium]
MTDTTKPDELLEAINAVNEAAIAGDKPIIAKNMELVKELVTREKNPLKVEIRHLVQAFQNCEKAPGSYQLDEIKNMLAYAAPSLQTIEAAKVQIADKKETGLLDAINNTDITTVKDLASEALITEKHLQAAVSNYAKFDIDKSDKIDDQRKILKILITKANHKTIENANLPAFTLGNQIIANEIATMIADKEPPTRAKTVLTLVSPSNQQMRK